MDWLSHTKVPVFDFQEPTSGKTISVMVPLTAPDKDRHVQIGEDGKVYKRVYAAPLAAVNSRITSTTKEEFQRITTGKKMKNGELFELSKEMSEERVRKDGKDPVKERFYRDYERQNGVKHLNELKEQKEKHAEEMLEKGREKLKRLMR